MLKNISRRDFIGIGATTALGLTAAGCSTPSMYVAGEAQPRVVRIGVIGVGGRGSGLLGNLLGMENVAIPAICDINAENLNKAKKMVVEAGQPTPEGYDKDETVFEELTAREDLDAVIIATPWHWHTPMAVSAMRGGKYTGVEVPAAITLDECWDLIHTSEETGVPCMMLENWSFRRDNLAVLKMIREGLLGQIVHCHCAHSHDCIDHWFYDKEGKARWPAEYLVQRNCDQYPTHSLGPVLSWMDINCGDRFETLTSTATHSRGINAYFREKFGPGHPGATREYKQGDIVTTTVKTAKGKSIVINYDMQLPRPYDNRWMIQGTKGIYNEQREAVYLTGQSPEYHQWEPFKPYQRKYDHAWWKGSARKIRKRGHGGVDYLELREFLKAVRLGTQTPIDVYDSVVMSCIVPLSERSIAQGSAPVPCPDFTQGKWKTNKPYFAMET